MFGEWVHAAKDGSLGLLLPFGADWWAIMPRAATVPASQTSSAGSWFFLGEAMNSWVRAESPTRLSPSALG